MLKRLLRGERAQAVLACLLGRYLAFALATTRWSLDGLENLQPHIADQAAIFAFWHERLPLMPALWTLAHRREGPRVRPGRVLVSRHADGRFIGRVMAQFGVGAVHGSTSRGSDGKGGAAGLRALLESVQSGHHAIITPDGPRGPRRRAAAGTARLAALSGAPIVPCGAQTSRRMVLKTWDRMVLPLPWGRGVLVCLPPLHVARDAAEDALPAIEAALDAAADRADRRLRAAPAPAPS